MDEQYCINCRFYSLMKCHRHAPVVVQLKEHSRTEFPQVYELEWCGDWEKIIEKPDVTK